MATKKKLTPPPTIGKRLAHSDVAAQLARRKPDGSDSRKPDGTRPLRPDVQFKHVPRPSASHKFRAGQTVTLLPNRYGSNRNASFEVTRLLPEEHGINHYRLKSVVDGHERVAGEDELL